MRKGGYGRGMERRHQNTNGHQAGGNRKRELHGRTVRRKGWNGGRYTITFLPFSRRSRCPHASATFSSASLTRSINRTGGRRSH